MVRTLVSKNVQQQTNRTILSTMPQKKICSIRMCISIFTHYFTELHPICGCNKSFTEYSEHELVGPKKCEKSVKQIVSVQHIHPAVDNKSKLLYYRNTHRMQQMDIRTQPTHSHRYTHTIIWMIHLETTRQTHIVSKTIKLKCNDPKSMSDLNKRSIRINTEMELRRNIEK